MADAAHSPLNEQPKDLGVNVEFVVVIVVVVGIDHDRINSCPSLVHPDRNACLAGRIDIVLSVVVVAVVAAIVVDVGTEAAAIVAVVVAFVVVVVIEIVVVVVVVAFERLDFLVVV
jgi:hypothetical protein